jgi:hypothetical protein
VPGRAPKFIKVFLSMFIDECTSLGAWNVNEREEEKALTIVRADDCLQVNSRLPVLHFGYVCNFPSFSGRLRMVSGLKKREATILVPPPTLWFP